MGYRVMATQGFLVALMGVRIFLTQINNHLVFTDVSGNVTQSVEYPTFNRSVVGSSPIIPIVHHSIYVLYANILE
jgi:hypothetical protein